MWLKSTYLIVTPNHGEKSMRTGGTVKVMTLRRDGSKKPIFRHIPMWSSGTRTRRGNFQLNFQLDTTSRYKCLVVLNDRRCTIWIIPQESPSSTYISLVLSSNQPNLCGTRSKVVNPTKRKLPPTFSNLESWVSGVGVRLYT